ncbi:alkaline-phosphatase-like protein [Obelidium mucronatum]|nr:alkaline-phosphatase-like protein [Obelidium mucronatum]
MQFKSLLIIATFALTAFAAPDASTPAVGQKNRYRALPRGSNLAIVPVDGAEFLAGQKFDISVELHSEDGKAPDLSALSFTINGKQVKDVIVNATAPYTSTYNSTYYADGQSEYANKPTTFHVSRASWRRLSLPASGDYNVELSVGSEKVKAKWVVKGSSTRKVKNALLFIGDGMAPTMISAARYISRNTKFGKFANGEGFLEMEKWDTMGKISTNGIDAIITDSANSAAAYTSGHKGWVNTLNVYADTTTGDQLDDAKVETITEVIRRVRPGMCIGIVTTASVVDATPAAFYGHTRSRSQGDVLVDQALNGFKHLVLTNKTSNTWVERGESMPWGPAVKPDVLFGGGGDRFKGSKAMNGSNYYDAFTAAGYKVVNDKDELKNVGTGGAVLGIFTAGHMDTWYEREFNKEGLKTNPNSSPKLDKTTAMNQPGLELMTLKAIEIMEKKCSDGWFLMSEAAAVDKSMHPMDYDRGLADLLELDRTLKAVRSLPSAKETAIFLTADHAQGYDVYGSVDLNYFRSAANDDSQRNAIGVYQDAGWVDNVLDANGLPTRFTETRYRLAGGKVDMPDHVENFEFKAPAAGANPLTLYMADPHDSVNSIGLPRAGNLPASSGHTVHTLQAVDLYCFGPVAASCGKHMDNTELFFLMANALGLGDVADAPSKNVYSSAASFSISAFVALSAALFL